MAHLRISVCSLWKVILAFLSALLAIGTCAGIVYFALQGSVSGVAISAIVPGLAGMTAAGSFWKSIGAPSGRPLDHLSGSRG